MDIDLLHQNKRANQWQSFKLIAGMAAILGGLGFAILSLWEAGWIGAVAALPVAILVAWFGPRVRPSVLLRMFKARLIAPDEAPQIYEIHALLCKRAELEHIPPLYYVPSRMPNAFAAGTGKRSVVAMTDGIIRMMSARELAGVLAHEVSHIRHEDVQIMGLADSFSRFASTVARLGLILFVLALLGGYWQGFWRLLLLLLAPAMTTVLQLALSRSREFNADMGAAELTNDPQGLAMALNKLEQLTPKSWIRKVLFPGNKEPQATALRTHPPTAERVERLMALVPKFEDTPNLIDDDSKVADVSLYKPIQRKPRWHIVSGFWH